LDRVDEGLHALLGHRALSNDPSEPPPLRPARALSGRPGGYLVPGGRSREPVKAVKERKGLYGIKFEEATDDGQDDA
jgi:hypothetical protein